MRPSLRIIPILGVFMLAAWPRATHAEQRTPPEATQHALDELANCRAQQRPECPTAGPTATLVPTWTPSPTSTSTPIVLPTDEPAIAPTATVAPCWFTDQDLGDPDNNYIVFDSSGAPVPCPTDTPTGEPTDTPADTPTPAPPPTRTVPARPVPPPPAAAAPQVQVRTVIQTVVVEVTAAPSDTPVMTSTPTRTPRPSPSATPTATATVSPTATGTPTALAIALLAGPTPQAPTVAGARQVGRWDWGGFLRTVAIVLVAFGLVILVVIRRRVVVWRTRGHGGSSRA